MKKGLFIFIALLGLAAIFSCNKAEKQFKRDREKILADLAKKNLTAVEDASGIFSVIDKPGSSEHPDLSSTVKVSYKGTLLDGAIFDETDPGQSIQFPLQNLIKGWQICIPLLGKGGHGTFWIPSELCYGPNGTSGIPGNSVLIFEISLINF
jgi:FKBP-type peptidyl-prolyl cis-trans isomerase FkpA